MERLTEKVLGNIQLKACGNDFCKETCAEHDEEKSCNNCPIQKAFEKLAEYEDLEEQRRLLKLPCKAGQKVYLFRKDIKTVIDGEITSFDIGEFAKDMRIFITDDNRYTNISFDKVGDIIFFTRKEAEDKLAEMEGEEVKAEEIKKLKNSLIYDIENTPNGDRIWIATTKDFVDLLGKALNELEEMEKNKVNNDLSRFFTPEAIEKSIECLQKYLNSEPPRKLESEEKSMLHNVTVKHEENKVLEKYWLLRAIKDGDMYGQPPTPKRVISEQELDHEPTPQEIAQFLSDSKADFVSVVQNYRFESELPF